MAGKWFFFPGDWEEAHGDAGGGRKQRFVNQMLFSRLGFSFWRREGRGETLEKRKPVCRRVCTNTGGKARPEKPFLVAQNRPDVPLEHLSSAPFPKCSPFPKPASDPEGFALKLLLIPLRSIQKSLSCFKLGPLRRWDFRGNFRVCLHESDGKCFGAGGNAQKLNRHR